MNNECLTVTVERITFCNEQNGYYVLKTSSPLFPHKLTVVGNFGSITPGEEIRVHGEWGCHPSFGQQFHASSFTVLKPATLKGIEKYLGSGLIKGIGPVTAKALVKQFGFETLEIIEKHPERLCECPGIGSSKAELITKGFFLQRSIQDIMVFLQGHGISPAYAVRIYKKYNRQAMQKVASNPYILAYEIQGMGFKKADAIASEFGITGNDPRRIKAGVLYVLNNALSEGHLFLREDEIKKALTEALNFQEDTDTESIFSELQSEKRLFIRQFNGQRLYYPLVTYNAEELSAQLVSAMLKKKQSITREVLLQAINEAVANHGLHLSDLQQYAVESSLTNSFLIITGGPGTGKTTVLKAVVAAHKAIKRSVMLSSPTGRAAKRLSEVSGYAASTLHRLLEYSPADGKFKRNRERPLECDTIIVDEASMIDIKLFCSLLQAVSPHASVVLVGDSDQLPSVGPGLVLNELITSQRVPVVRLSEVFRQSEASNIIKNAHLINSGQMPNLQVPDGATHSDCYLVSATEPDRVISLLKNIVQKSLPSRFGFNPITDIQVLTPMNKGPLGSIALNAVLQSALNPPSPTKGEIEHLKRVFRVGDKVIQLKNNYSIDVFNGDIGIIRAIDAENSEALIDFEQGAIRYSSDDFVDLAHAYAITVHKSQGSEYPAVVFIASTQHYVMLQRNLLYTGLTRAKKTMVFLGGPRAIKMAVDNNRPRRRNTVLASLIQQLCP